MSGAPSVSVVVVTYANADEIAATLAVVREQLREGDELIVLDNASPDATAVAVAAAAPDARLIAAATNTGFAAGANAAAAQAHGDLLVLLNPDCVLEAGALDALRAGAARWDVWQGLVLHDDGATINTAGGEMHPLGLAWAGACDRPRSDAGDAGEVAFASGAFLAIRRELWQRLGGLPEPFFMYCEDVDLSLRARLAGLRVGAEPDAVARHAYDFAKGARKWRALERNRWLVVLRTYPPGLLAAVLPAMLALEPILMAIAARDGWLAAKLAAQLDVARALPRTLRERRDVQRSRSVGSARFAAALTPTLDSPYFGRVGSSPTISALLAGWWRLTIGVLRRVSRDAR